MTNELAAKQEELAASQSSLAVMSEEKNAEGNGQRDPQPSLPDLLGSNSSGSHRGLQTSALLRYPALHYC